MSQVSYASSERKVLPFARDDRAIVEGIRRGEPWAAELLFERHGPAVTRMLRRTLGCERHEELVDLVHEVFAQAIASMDRLREAEALLAWLQRISAHVAYRTMRNRRARRWLSFLQPDQLPEVPHEAASPEIQQACRRVYGVLERLPASERLVFSLRMLEGLELVEVAAACEISVSTAKRRIAKAQKRFASLAAQDAVLRDWLQEGVAWTR